MRVFLAVVLIIISYFIGNISPATLLARAAGKDITKEGSGNAGTTNVLRTLGAKAALITLFVDVTKGFIATRLGLIVSSLFPAATGPDTLWYAWTISAWCGLAVFIGHIWPILFNMKGGKGVATALGVLFAVNWKAALMCLGVFIVVVALSKMVSLGSILAAAAFPVFLVLLLIGTVSEDIPSMPRGAFYAVAFGPQVLPLIIMALILIIKHKANIKRIIHGEENKLSFKKKSTNVTENIEKESNTELTEKGVNMSKKKICIIGYGSFGTALSILLAGKGHDVYVTDMNKELLVNAKKDRKNERYLPGVEIPEGVSFILDDEDSISLSDALNQAEIVLFAVPAQKFRVALSGIKDMIPDDAILVDVAKGIEIESLMRLSEIAEDVKPGVRYVALSGPSHAEEVGIGLPTTVAVSSEDKEAAEIVQEVFSTERFRVYTNDDIIGVELGGSLKNIMALGAGIADGLGFGDNAKAALMTRGLAEITRLGVEMGAKEMTFLGLAGVGDLIVTCTSMHSRNRRCGILIGQGVSVPDAIEEVGMVVEGAYTCEAACKLADKLGVDMPITKSIKACLDGEITPGEAIKDLMTRSLKSE